MEQKIEKSKNKLNNNGIGIKEIVMSLWKGKVIIAVAIIASVLLSFIYSFFVVSEEYAAKTIIITSPIDFTTNDIPSGDSVIDFLTQMPKMTLDTFKQQLTSTAVLDRVIRKLDFKAESGDFITADNLERSIEVTNTPNTNQLIITVNDSNAARAAATANGLVQVFIEYIDEKSKKQVQDVVEIIDQQISIETQNLADKTKAISDFWQTNGSIAELKKVVESQILQLVTFKYDLNNIETQILTDTDTLKALQSAASSAGAINPDDYNLFIDLTDSAEEQQKVQVKVSSDALSASLLTIDMNKIQTRLVSNYYKKQTLLQQIKVLEADLNERQTTLAGKEYIYEALNNDIAISRKAFDIFQQKLKKAKTLLEADIGHSSITVTTEALIPQQPLSPNKMLNLILAALLGLVLGVCVIYIKESWGSSESASNEEMNGK
jgi:polysaccharide biosynthesis transport protein